MAGKSTAPCTLRLNGELTVRTIAEAQQKLVAALAKSKTVFIDTTGTSEADLTLVQLIEAARRSAEAEGKKLALSPPPAGALCEVLQRGGFLSDGASFWKGE